MSAPVYLSRWTDPALAHAMAAPPDVAGERHMPRNRVARQRHRATVGACGCHGRNASTIRRALCAELPQSASQTLEGNPASLMCRRPDDHEPRRYALSSRAGQSPGGSMTNRKQMGVAWLAFAGTVCAPLLAGAQQQQSEN